MNYNNCCYCIGEISTFGNEILKADHIRDTPSEQVQCIINYGGLKWLEIILKCWEVFFLDFKIHRICEFEFELWPYIIFWVAGNQSYFYRFVEISVIFWCH